MSSQAIHKHTVLFPTLPQLITLTGAGGKTSIMFWIASAVKEMGKRVITTTTTKMFFPESGEVILQADASDFLAEIASALEIHSTVTVASRYDAQLQKLIGISPEDISMLLHSKLADCILVEGDGAARKPLKAPNQHEPVIPAETDVCIGVMGLDALYAPLSSDTVHRHELFTKLTGRGYGENITPADLIALATSPKGLFQHCPATSQKYVFLNKMDIPNTLELVETIHSKQSQHPTDTTWLACTAQHRKIFNISDTQTEVVITS